jgi:hypothetical protein
MALIIRGSSQCAICRNIVGAEDDIVATSAFLGREHPLWPYSDAAMHRECFVSWKDKAEFVAAFNSIVSPEVAGDGTSRLMLDDGRICVLAVDPGRHGSERKNDR